MSNLMFTKTVLFWRHVDEILSEMGYAPSTAREIHAAMRRTPRAENAAVQIATMRRVRSDLYVIQGGKA